MRWLDDDSPGRIVSRAEIGELFGLSGTTLDALVAAGLPGERGGPGVAGKYATAVVARWITKRELRRAGSALEAEREALLRVRRERAQLEFAVRANLFVEVDAVRRSRHETAVTVATGFRNGPSRWAPILASLSDPRAIEEFLAAEVDRVLSTLESDLERADENDVPASAAPRAPQSLEEAR
jgi:phage terminase Nu1 subunit (DNA packaging protein)